MAETPWEEVVNADAVVVAQAPKLAAHIEAMKEALCPVLGVERDSLGIKAKTTRDWALSGGREPSPAGRWCSSKKSGK